MHTLRINADAVNTVSLGGAIVAIGNEGNGIAPELIERADVKIKIPMAGTIESLNAAVAAAILMYEGVRGRGTGQA